MWLEDNEEASEAGMQWTRRIFKIGERGGHLPSEHMQMTQNAP